MIAPDAPDPEEQLAALLAACDEAMAAGVPAESFCSVAAPVPLRARLQRDLECMQVLRRLRQSSTPNGFSTSSSSDTAVVAPEAPLPEGTRLGRFEIRRELGRGGYGVVLLAYDPNLGREIALKIPRPDVLITAELRARFQHEGRAAAGLDHPHIVPVHEAGEIGTVSYLASAYCPGITLAAWLAARTQPVEFREAAALVATLADAIHHAHTRGVLHRDLKPANVLLQKIVRSPHPAPSKDENAATSSAGYWLLTADYSPKITDFGLAKFLQDELSGPSRKYITQTGAIVGTPNYMAPEQARADSKQITTATDVYALGVILYELITGRPPFQGANPLEILRQIDTAEPTAPSRTRPDLPRDLETICLKCLEKDPSRRYTSAAALADDLRRFLAHEPIQARAVGVWELVRKWARRRPEMAALVVVIVVAAMALLVGGFWYSARLSKALDVAERQRTNADNNFMLARQAVENYLAKVTESKRLTEADFHPLRKELLQAALPFYERFVERAENDPALRADQGRAHERLGKVHHLLGEMEQALANFQEMQAIFAELTQLQPESGNYRQSLGQAYNNLGDTLVKLGRLEEAERAHAKALLLQEELAAHSPEVAEYRRDAGFSHFSRALVLGDLGRTAELESEYRLSLALHEQLARDFPSNPDYRRRLAWSRNNLANHALAPTGRYEEAEHELREALALKEKLVRDFPTDPDYRLSVANSHIALSNLFHRRELSREAEGEQRQALSILQRLGETFPSVPDYRSRLAQCHDNLGSILRDLDHPGQAKEQFQQALALYGQLAAEHPEIAEYQWGIANSRALVCWQLAHEGSHQKAAEELAQVDERAAGSGMARYNVACGWSLASAAALKDMHLSSQDRQQRAAEYAARSLAWLRKSIDVGYFRDGANFDLLKEDHNLSQPVRSMPEFRAVLKEMDEKGRAR